jgi:putative acetyltransferase
VAAVHAVHTASFPTDVEARLVDLLRSAGRLPVSLVAEMGDAVVGHVAFSPVTAVSGAVGVGLAPVAVVEPHRRRGIAAAFCSAVVRPPISPMTSHGPRRWRGPGVVDIWKSRKYYGNMGRVVITE